MKLIDVGPLWVVASLLGCAHTETPVAEKTSDTARSTVPVRIEVRDMRTAHDDELARATVAHARRYLAQRGLQIVDDAPTALQIDILAVEVTWKDGIGRTCSRLLGRTVRDEKGYLAIDVPAEKCEIGERRVGGAGEIAPVVGLAAELIDPNKPPSTGTAAYLSVLEPLLVQLANQSRAPEQ